MKELLITHNDLDAVGCAIVFKDRYPDIEVQYHDYKTITEISQKLLNGEYKKYEKIFFADISPEESEGLHMVNVKKYTIIDHHETRNYLEKTVSWSPNVIFDINQCAALLSYKHIHNVDNTNIPTFIWAVDAWDSWILNSIYRKYGEELNLLLGYVGKHDFVRRFSRMPDSLDASDKIIVRILDNMKQEYLSHKLEQVKTMIDENDNKYWEVHIGESQSGMGNLLEMSDLKHQKEIKYLKTINLNDGIVSLYSLGFDVSILAKEKGGGGHAKAAGYTIRTDKNKISQLIN